MNSVMQCLNSLTPLVTYFKGEDYLRDIHPKSKYNGTLASEVGAAFKTMNSRAGPISLSSLKKLIDNLYSPFKGFRQEDAHEFLIKLVELMCEDLGIGEMATFHYTPDDILIGQIGGNVSGILEILQSITGLQSCASLADILPHCLSLSTSCPCSQHQLRNITWKIC